MSAESGVPTFRDAQAGLWSTYDPGQLASPEGFRADPALVWRWYAMRRAKVSRAEPNAGHLTLADRQRSLDSLAIVTQNVDGLHTRAGSAGVLELHGNIQRTKCLADCGFRIEDPASLPDGEPPKCPACGSWLRPDVVWFGESLDAGVLGRSHDLAARCDVMIVVGTSGLVYPAAGLPAIAKRQGSVVIVVNPNASQLDSAADILVRKSAATALPELFAGRWQVDDRSGA